MIEVERVSHINESAVLPLWARLWLVLSFNLGKGISHTVEQIRTSTRFLTNGAHCQPQQ